MNAAFFSPTPRSASSQVAIGEGRRARHVHRWVATIFTLTVAANFAVMPWGPPPAWITYAPLPPLLFLMITGLTMLVSSWIGQGARTAGHTERNRAVSDPVSKKIDSLGDWRGALLARIRQTINVADPGIVEEIKWRKAANPLGVPTWSHNGIICTGESYTDKVKLTFMKGGDLDDKQRLFNVPADGVRRAIDFKEHDELNEAAFTALVREAIAANLANRKSG